MNKEKPSQMPERAFVKYELMNHLRKLSFLLLLTNWEGYTMTLYGPQIALPDVISFMARIRIPP